jgi:tetratricopeptide (TPR) repeat protein
MGANACWFSCLFILGTAACPERASLKLLPAQLPSDLPSLLRLVDDVVGPRKDLPHFLRVLAAARRAVELAPQDPGVLWRAARAAYLVADSVTEKAEIERWADEGARLAERAILLDGRSAEAHYYLATNLGLVAYVRQMSALSLVNRIAEAARRAADLAPDFDRGGPLRLLGLLYAKAPPWPTSIGDVEEGIRWLRQAVQRFPDEPLNRLFLAEALLAEKQYDAAEAELKLVLAAPPKDDWARVGARWRRHARQLLRRIAVARHHGDE